MGAPIGPPGAGGGARCAVTDPALGAGLIGWPGGAPPLGPGLCGTGGAPCCCAGCGPAAGFCVAAASAGGSARTWGGTVHAFIASGTCVLENSLSKYALCSLVRYSIDPLYAKQLTGSLMRSDRSAGAVPMRRSMAWCTWNMAVLMSSSALRASRRLLMIVSSSLSSASICCGVRWWMTLNRRSSRFFSLLRIMQCTMDLGTVVTTVSHTMRA
mmetsp:Transcript_22795/g.57980  ORF Transcript_22795/g.57980 Transcript_22795/m.57980 type:complete len:213 (-) Transcript_22795:1915-2553(-)